MLVLFIIFYLLYTCFSITNKVEHYNNYINSALLQGFWPYDDNPIRDSNIATNSNSVINVTFPVYSTIKWNPSGFYIRAGHSYKVVADLGGIWYDGGIATSYVGYKSWFDSISNCYVGDGRCRAHLRFKRRFSEANWFAMVCGIGTLLQPVILPNIGDYIDTRFLPLDETSFYNTFFVIDKDDGVEFTSKWSGELVCFANDAHNLYWNNAGYINVTVSNIL